jgi:hypothetical protein
MSRDASHTGFSPDEERALSSVLDRIIPPSSDGRLPGAGEIGLASHIVEALEEAPELCPVIVQGLATLDDLASRRGSPGFSALPERDRSEVLRELETAQPGFFPGLIIRTYAAYYRHARVVEALGLEARPPHPKGYEMEPGDFASLDRVRERTKLYRDC